MGEGVPFQVFAFRVCSCKLFGEKQFVTLKLFRTLEFGGKYYHLAALKEALVC